MKAAIYLRVSSDEQALHGYSLAAQRHACRERARQLGAEEIQEWADEGIPGTVWDRPGLTQLRQAVSARAIDLVVIYDPDRFARSLALQLVVTEEIERAGVQLEFVNFDWQDTPEGKLFYAMRGAFSEYEREKIRLRTSLGRLQKARQGHMPMAVAPYGYRYDPETARLEVHPEEAPIVVRMFTECVQEQKSLNSIARQLTAERIPTRKGLGVWHRQVIRQILQNPVYTGTFYANRYETYGVGLNRFRPAGTKLRRKVRPRSEWIGIPAPRLIEPAMWEAAQQRMRVRTRTPGPSYLLAGLVRCGLCGQTLVGRRDQSWGRPNRIYTCRKHSAGAAHPGCRPERRLDADALEDAIWQGMTSYGSRLLQQLAEKPVGEAGDRRSRLDRITRAQGHLLDALAEGLGDPAVIRRRLRALEEERRALDPFLSPPSAPSGRVFGWEEIPVYWRREILEVLVRGIVVGDGQLTIVLKTDSENISAARMTVPTRC